MTEDEMKQDGQTEEGGAGLAAPVGSALRKIAEIVRIHELYEGPPCHNKRHGDELEIATVTHGNDRVTLTLGDCRAIMANK